MILPNFRKSILYFYIDHEHFNGYYGDVLYQITPITEEERVFLSCIAGLRDFMSGYDFPIVDILRPADLKGFYPVLAGRYVGALILSGRKPASHILNRYVHPLCQKFAPHYFLLEVFTALILKGDVKSLETLIQRYYEELYEMDHWYAHQTINIYLIGECLVYLSEHNLRRAQIAFDSIQLHFTSIPYLPYTQHFYRIAEWNLLHQTGVPQNRLTSVEENIAELAATTGFHRFSVEFVQSYFDA